jgi:DNA helicase-2/ATP-dependent DNA helicase PcrA
MKYSGVTLTTAHSSKGLEWKHVYVSTSKFDKPEYHDENPTKELEEIVEEERRLIYVAMTRARDELMVTGKYYCFGNLSQFKGTKFTPSGQNANLFLQELYDIVGKGDLVTEYKSITAASSRKAS